MAEAREFRTRAGFAVAAAIGFSICILVSFGYMAGRRWANVWPSNLITEALSLTVSTWLVLRSYVRLWVGEEGITIRMPRETRSIKWAELAAYEIFGRFETVCTLRSFGGTTIRIRLTSFEDGGELGELIERLATKPV